MPKPEKELEIFKKILDTLPNSIYLKDTDGRYVWLNKASKNQLKDIHLISESIMGKTDFDVFPEITAKEYAENDAIVVKTRKGLVKEEVVVLPNGRELTQLSFKEPLYDDALSEVIGVLGYTIDISERKMAERTKSEFIANMSHDIRTPITGMIGIIQGLINTAQEVRSSVSDPSFTTVQALCKQIENISNQVESDSHILMNAVHQLLHLCNEVLEVSRLNSHYVDTDTECFDLYDLVKRNVTLLQTVARDKNLNLKSEIDKNISQYLKGKRNYLDRIILNLLSNALKFTETGDVILKIHLTDDVKNSYKSGDTIYIHVVVVDTGIGIPEDKFETIFENFSRLTPSYEGNYKGYGLGLYMVKRYVEIMKGEIKLESKLGQGTSFSIMIPFIVADKTDQPPSSIIPFIELKHLDFPKFPAAVSLSHAEVNKSLGIHVLVVEDSSLAAMAVSILLKPFNCVVDFAETGTAAIEKSKNNHYSLVLMDVGLPDLCGIEVTKTIRSLADLTKSQVPIIGLTGHADNPEMQQECLRAGMQDVLTKPLQPCMLESILKRFV